MSTVTLIGVTGHFIAFTFIVVIIRDVVGIHGPHLAWLLAAFGVAGLAGMAAMARPLDLWPKTSVLGCLAVLAAALLTLSVLGFDHLSASGLSLWHTLYPMGNPTTSHAWPVHVLVDGAGNEIGVFVPSPNFRS